MCPVAVTFGLSAALSTDAACDERKLLRRVVPLRYLAGVNVRHSTATRTWVDDTQLPFPAEQANRFASQATGSDVVALWTTPMGLSWWSQFIHLLQRLQLCWSNCSLIFVRSTSAYEAVRYLARSFIEKSSQAGYQMWATATLHRQKLATAIVDCQIEKGQIIRMGVSRVSTVEIRFILPTIDVRKSPTIVENVQP